MASEPVSPESLHAAQYLVEHCVDCHGTGRTGWPLNVSCAVCGGSGRRRRHTHDRRSAIDFEEFGPSPFYALIPQQKKLQRAAELARVLRDETNSAPLRELLDLVVELGT